MKVSVVCAWFNRSVCLRDTIDSLLAQKFDDYEIIIINDGSTDKNVKIILDQYNDDRLRIYHQSNQGLVSTLIRGTGLAEGKYIAIQGAGDISAPERLLEQYSYLEANTGVAAVGTGYYTRADGAVDGHYVEPEALVDQDTLIKNVPSTHGTIMYRKSALFDVGGYDSRFKYCSDWNLYFRLIKKYSIESINKPLYTKIEFDDGFSFDPDKKFTQYEFSKKARGLHGKESGLRKSRLLTYLLLTIKMAYLSFISRRYKRAGKWLLQIPGILTGKLQRKVDESTFW